MKSSAIKKKKTTDLAVVSFRLRPEEIAFFYSFDPLSKDEVFSPSATRAMRVILSKLAFENHEGRPDKKKTK
jgi:hypothetical protein